MVEGRPPGQGPASRSRSTPGPNSWATSWASSKAGLPERLALVPVTGKPREATRRQVTDCRGWRTPMVLVPPVSQPGKPGRAGKIKVRGPGQNLAISRPPAGGTAAATWASISGAATNTRTGIPGDGAFRGN